MTLDLIASIELTASAAIVIAALSIGFGKTVSARVKIASGLMAWFALVTILAVTEALHYQHGVGVIGLGVAVMLPILIISIGVLRSPALHSALVTIPLPILIGVNTIRIIGFMFLILYAAGRLPAPFAPVAGWGDVLIGITAAPLAWMVYRMGDNARLMIMIWNSLGLLDLVAAVGLGATSSPGPLRLIFAEPGTAIMTTLPWLLIPGFLVPLLASTHLAVFYRLFRRETVSAGRRGLQIARQQM